MFLGHIIFCFSFTLLQKSIFSPVFSSCCDTQEKWSHTLQRTDTQQQCNNEDAIITLLGKRGSFIAVEPPFAANRVSQRNLSLRILIAHLLVGLTNMPKHDSIFLLKTTCCVESISDIGLTHGLHSETAFSHTPHLHEQAERSQCSGTIFAAFMILQSFIQGFFVYLWMISWRSL